MSIRLMTFDLDDTLWSVKPVITAANQALGVWLLTHAPKLGELSSERLGQLRGELVAQQPLLDQRVSELRYQVLLRALLQSGYPELEARDLAEQAFQVFLAERQKVELFADVVPTLEQLRHSYMLGALSNGNADVRRVGLGEYFSFALSADILGVAKPEPEVFLAALARAQVKPAHSIHIGDHPEHDVFGAQQVGMRTIWFNPEQKIWTGEREPDAQINQISQLPDLIKRFDE
ncbi:HAD family hydrolase [Denitrificimonas caeni]|uniref:HAD family hydrolase n=1 Tax=Denitrificimonas caeni TaxID=521720 RepID=A0AAE9VT08_9GAMM|nr:HAD family hydrolase [Denitrificimonas caeni]WBE25289.1 HAD family hydrolase [Denitrificimonas caeni]